MGTRELLYALCSTEKLDVIFSSQTPLLHHYHPAIALHARQLLLSQPLTASADLSQNTLSHFLDRFVYKNPKKVKGGGGDEDENGVLGKTKGGSAMQPAASGYEGGGVKLRKGEVREVGGVRMNDESFLRKRAEDVPVDQVCAFSSCESGRGAHGGIVVLS